MRHNFDVRQRRPAHASEPLGQRSSRIERSTGKRAKAGDDDCYGHLDAKELRDFFNRKGRRELAGGDLSLCLSQLRAHGCIGA